MVIPDYERVGKERGTNLNTATMQDKYQQGLLFKMSTSSTESYSVRKLDKETFSDIDLSKVRLGAA
jgi:hypothetical protein